MVQYQDKCPREIMSAQDDKFCLKLDNFQNNIATTFRQLLGDTDFSDVTLISEDGQDVQAHQLILSASSTVFLNILKRNEHKHPMIYMRGLHANDLHAILDFIYHGEISVYQNDLNNFLIIAEELKLKGLSGVGHKERILDNLVTDDHNKIKKDLHENKQTIGKPPKEQDIIGDIKKEVIENLPAVEESLAVVSDSNTSVISIKNNSELDEQVSLMMYKVDGGWACSVCGKHMIRNQLSGTNRVNKGHMVQHIEANHMEASHSCEKCGKVFRTREAIRKHIFRMHQSN